MDLNHDILMELAKKDLSGLSVLEVLSGPLTRVTFQVGVAKVTFQVNDDYQYDILFVDYEGQIYTEAEFLKQFNDWVLFAAKAIKPIEMQLRTKSANTMPHYKATPATATTKEQALIQREKALDAREAELKRQEVLQSNEWNESEFIVGELEKKTKTHHDYHGRNHWCFRCCHYYFTGFYFQFECQSPRDRKYFRKQSILC